MSDEGKAGASGTCDPAPEERKRGRGGALIMLSMEPAPRAIDLKKDRGLTVEWADGGTSYYSIAYLRKMSPSADVRQQRDEQKKNPLAVLSATTVKAIESQTKGQGLTALGAELVGNYALRIRFSDGHDTGIYSWQYLREIDPMVAGERKIGNGE